MGSNRKILLVEDEMISAMYLSAKLRKMGFEVPPSATTGEGAISSAEKEMPDLILMDINLLGGMDGISAAGTIIQRRAVPVIYVTGYSDAEIIARAEKTRPFCILTKPLDLKLLERQILLALAPHS